MADCRHCAQLESERDAARRELAQLRATYRPYYTPAQEAIEAAQRAGRDLAQAAKSLDRIRHRIESRARQFGGL